MRGAWVGCCVRGLLPGESGKGKDEDFVEREVVLVELLAAMDENLEGGLDWGDQEMGKLVLQKFRCRRQLPQSRTRRVVLGLGRKCFEYTTMFLSG